MTGGAVLALVALAAAGGYAADLWRRPFRWCRRCQGTGRVTGSTGKRWGPCPRCTNRPPRPRIGASLVRPELRRKP
jgi:hypothetical protein